MFIVIEHLYAYTSNMIRGQTGAQNSHSELCGICYRTGTQG